MAGRKFQTVPDELLHVAEAAADFMANRGFTVRPEKQDLGYPYCPTLHCRRGHMTCVVEVVMQIDRQRLSEWVGYAKSSGQDFRVSYAVSAAAGLRAEVRDQLAAAGVGLLELDGDNCAERVVAQDLSLNVELPPLASMPKPVKRLLGLAYDHFDHGNWREGFEAAAQALEEEARRYLKRHIDRMIFVGKPVTPQQINRMTLGVLASSFKRIQNQNLDDKQIGATLDLINKDRIGVVHHRGRRRAENRLRANVGRHMWAICGAMKHVVK
jgi:hypothetical protein